jgi:hypothetical protein
VETAFDIAMSLMKLEHHDAGPDLENFFKIVRNTRLKHFLTEKAELTRGSLEASLRVS